MPKASFYFVLYLIGIVNLLSIITERDYALDSLVKDYEQPLKLSAPSMSQFVAGRSESVEVLVSNIKSPAERSSIQYHIAPHSDYGENGFASLPVIESETGNARFTGAFVKPGEYRYSVWANVMRQLPKGAGGQRVRTGSDTVTVLIVVSHEKSEIPGTKFSMAVDKKAEQWVSGIPYIKTVFVNTDPRNVSLAGLPAGFRRGAVGENSIQLIWDKPMPGTAKIALNGNAGRNLTAALDAASLAFSVNVEPPAWNPVPARTAYWNIPYTFQSRVGELDVNEYTINVFANGSIPVSSSRQFPIVVMPERTWSSLTFVATSFHGHEMLRTEIPVKSPPPPQIKWTSSRLEGDDYVVSFTAEDVGGKDVNVNCVLVQPSGLTAVLSARHGKSFTFTIKNVTATRPQALVVRTSIHGIGGVSVPLDRTFPILY
ncbi:MAG: hypothetical protein KF749_04645 [Bacteroidetes bacterium]|nr:hypothetical protein [Bacteroidota bacterium]MCW5895443.1 hypothetical protein [Bacteroidota bacterium]